MRIAEFGLVAASIVFGAWLARGEGLGCPPGPISDATGGQVQEADFAFENVARSLEFFHKDFPRAVEEEAKGTSQVWGSEVYTIGYPNHLMEIEGVLLREHALLWKAALQFEVARAGEKSKDAQEAKRAYEAARARICAFIQKAVVSD